MRALRSPVALPSLTFCPGWHQGRRLQGYGLDPLTGWWVCGTCGRPTRLWWEGHKREIDEAYEAGLTSVHLGALHVCTHLRKPPDRRVSTAAALGKKRPAKHLPPQHLPCDECIADWHKNLRRHIRQRRKEAG